MSKDINNFKETTNSILKDIQVTEELKLSTLKKCKEQKTYNLKPFFATAASVAIITFSILSYKFIFHKPNASLTYNKETPNKSVTFDKQESKYSNDENNATDKSKSNSNETSSAKTIEQNNQTVDKNKKTSENTTSSIGNNKAPITSTQNKAKEDNINSSLPDNKQINTSSKNLEVTNNTPIEKNVTANTSSDASEKKSAINPENTETPSLKASLSQSSKSISISDAENFWGGKLLMPSYIPEGFELTDISLPKIDSKEVYVKLNYSFKNIYFKISQNKSTTSTSYVGKIIDINGSKAYVTKNKDTSNPSILNTEINLVRNNVQYNITGNIQEDEIIKIIKSMN